jgi:hypothetical protein
MDAATAGGAAMTICAIIGAFWLGLVAGIFLAAILHSAKRHTPHDEKVVLCEAAWDDDRGFHVTERLLP